MKCATIECEREATLRGYCQTCYSRLIRNGTLKKLPVKGKEKCAVEDCQRLVGKDGGYGYCSMHYQRYKLHGDPNIVYWKALKGETIEEKLKQNYVVDGDCWIWQGSVNNTGYGSINIGNGKTALVHRLAYKFWKGEVPNNFFVCHYCDTPLCINLDHLFLGTNQDNMDDKINKGRAYTGIHKGEKNQNSKLSSNDVTEIKKMLSSGKYEQAEIGKKFNVSRKTVCDINRGRCWTHIPWPKKKRKRKRLT